MSARQNFLFNLEHSSSILSSNTQRDVGQVGEGVDEH